jgi:hypothetical protein
MRSAPESECPTPTTAFAMVAAEVLAPSVSLGQPQVRSPHLRFPPGSNACRSPLLPAGYAVHRGTSRPSPLVAPMKSRMKASLLLLGQQERRLHRRLHVAAPTHMRKMSRSDSLSRTAIAPPNRGFAISAVTHPLAVNLGRRGGELGQKAFRRTQHGIPVLTCPPARAALRHRLDAVGLESSVGVRRNVLPAERDCNLPSTCEPLRPSPSARAVERAQVRRPTRENDESEADQRPGQLIHRRPSPTSRWSEARCRTLRSGQRRG